MIRALTTAALLPALALAQTFTPLFNGTSLAGWAVQGQGTWEVKEGIIQGTGQTSNPKNTWLISEKATYKDFDFRFKFMGVSGNSGLNFRSTQGTEDVTGMQVDIDGGRTTGSLYEVIVRNGQYAGAYVAQPPSSQVGGLYKASDWNQVDLKVRGMQVEVTLNGTRVVNHTLARGEAQGFFAFQLHDKAVTRISLKDIEVAEAGGVTIRMRPIGNGETRPLALYPEAGVFDLAGRRLSLVPVAEGLSPEPRAGGPYFLAP